MRKTRLIRNKRPATDSIIHTSHYRHQYGNPLPFSFLLNLAAIKLTQFTVIVHQSIGLFASPY